MLSRLDLREIKEFLSDALKYILIGIVILLIFVYVISLEQVIGPSMEPNYKEREIYLLNKIKYKFTDPKRFEVVVVSTSSSKYMIKRVIGLPNDKLEYKNNNLYINDELIEENYDRTGSTENFGPLIIPENSYFVLGDNRENSTDSRKFGYIEKKDVIGKVEFRLWPIIK